MKMAAGADNPKWQETFNPKAAVSIQLNLKRVRWKRMLSGIIFMD